MSFPSLRSKGVSVQKVVSIFNLFPHKEFIEYIIQVNSDDSLCTMLKPIIELVLNASEPYCAA